MTATHDPALSRIDAVLVRGLADGRTYAEIGRPYDWTAEQVTDQVRRIRRRYRARNAAHLVAIALRFNLID